MSSDRAPGANHAIAMFGDDDINSDVVHGLTLGSSVSAYD